MPSTEDAKARHAARKRARRQKLLTSAQHYTLHRFSEALKSDVLALSTLEAADYPSTLVGLEVRRFVARVDDGLWRITLGGLAYVRQNALILA